MRIFLGICFLCLLSYTLGAQSAPVRNYARPLQRTDLFLAVPYGSGKVLILFSGEGAGGAGRPLAVLSAGIVRGRLSVVANALERKAWYADWPANGAPAPQVGDRFTVAVGGARGASATLTELGFLATCHPTWIVGVAAVEDGGAEALTGADSARSAAVFLAWPTVKTTVNGGGSSGQSPAQAPGRTSAQTPGVASAQTSPAPPEDLGPVVFSGESSPALGAEARRRMEEALNQRMVGDYTALLSERQMLYQQTHPTPLAEVEGDSALLHGTAKLVYSVQRVQVAEGTARYYVRAQWRSGGKNLYFLRAWFTPEFSLESALDSGIPEGPDALDLERKNGERKGATTDILNVFDASVVHVTERVGLIELQEPGNLIVMRQSGPLGLRYVLLRWSPSGLLPAGVSFSPGC